MANSRTDSKFKAGSLPRLVLARGQWRVDWITKLGDRRGCINEEWYKRRRDAWDREKQLKRGGFEVSVWRESSPVERGATAQPNEGQIIINAIIRAGAILTIEKTSDESAIIVWHANAPEQIEAALSEAGFVISQNGAGCAVGPLSDAIEMSATEGGRTAPAGGSL